MRGCWVVFCSNLRAVIETIITLSLPYGEFDGYLAVLLYDCSEHYFHISECFYYLWKIGSLDYKLDMVGTMTRPRMVIYYSTTVTISCWLLLILKPIHSTNILRMAYNSSPFWHFYSYSFDYNENLVSFKGMKPMHVRNIFDFVLLSRYFAHSLYLSSVFIV